MSYESVQFVYLLTDILCKYNLFVVHNKEKYIKTKIYEKCKYFYYNHWNIISLATLKEVFTNDDNWRIAYYDVNLCNLDLIRVTEM